MCNLDGLFQNNRAWANQRVKDDPEFFTRLASQQAPRYLWIVGPGSVNPAPHVYAVEVDGLEATFTRLNEFPPPPTKDSEG